MDKRIKQGEKYGASTSYTIPDGQYSSKVKSMCQEAESDPGLLSNRGKIPLFVAILSLKQELWSRNTQRLKSVRVSASGGHDYTVESSPLASKLRHGNNQKSEDNEIVKPAQQPPAFRKEGNR